AVSSETREIDPANERDVVVDDHELLVVAMHRPLDRIERTAHRRPAYKRLAFSSDSRAARIEQAQRRTRPQQHSHLRSLGRGGEQLAQRGGAAITDELELRLHVPAGD